SLGFYAAWKDLRTNNGQHIYAQSMDFGGNVLWNTNGEVVCNTTGNREVPKLITEPDNDNFFLTWSDDRGSNYDVYAQKMDSDGEILWNRNGVLVSSASGHQTAPCMTDDGYG